MAVIINLIKIVYRTGSSKKIKIKKNLKVFDSNVLRFILEIGFCGGVFVFEIFI